MDHRIRRLKRSLFGLDPVEVSQEVASLEQRYEQKAHALRNQLEEAKQEVRRLEQKLGRAKITREQRWDVEDGSMTELSKAYQEARELREKAKIDAASILEQTREDINRCRTRTELLITEYERLRQELEAILARHQGFASRCGINATAVKEGGQVVLREEERVRGNPGNEPAGSTGRLLFLQ